MKWFWEVNKDASQAHITPFICNVRTAQLIAKILVKDLLAFCQGYKHNMFHHQRYYYQESIRTMAS